MSERKLKDYKRIVLTGGAGFLGGAVQTHLLERGVQRDAIHIPRSSSCDLRKMENCLEVTKGTDLVIHLAASVGGIGYNQKNPGILFYDNAAMGINLIEACRINGVSKLVVAGTTCSYPKFCPIPFKEEDLWNGYPEETNAPYGVSKKILHVMLEAYREQYGLNGVYLIPVNLYGPNDDFHLQNSHVIPALIRKFTIARDENAETVSLWGDGSPTREFLYVDDAARGIVLAAENFSGGEAINIGSSEECKIVDLAEMIRAKVGFQGKIEWDTSRPNGQPRRKMDTEKAKKFFNFESKVSFEDGLDRTIRWWEENKLSYDK